jgi:uncharacterized protein (DUF2236 family)
VIGYQDTPRENTAITFQQIVKVHQQVIGYQDTPRENTAITSQQIVKVHQQVIGYQDTPRENTAITFQQKVKVHQKYHLGTIPQQQTQLRVPLTSKGYRYLLIY